MTRDQGRETRGEGLTTMHDKQHKIILSASYGYRDLIVWQKGMELAKSVYGITRKFPAEEKYGLVSQMRRAAVSIPSNVAEGHACASHHKGIHPIHLSCGGIFGGVGYSDPIRARDWILLKQRDRATLHAHGGIKEDAQLSATEPFRKTAVDERVSCPSPLVPYHSPLSPNATQQPMPRRPLGLSP